MATTNKKIQETGPVGLKGVRGEDLYPKGFKGEQLQISAARNKAALRTNVNPTLFDNIGIAEKTNDTQQGKSMFDDAVMINPTPETIQDTRANNQPWYAQLAAGVGKGAVLAGTTFVDGTLGIIAGLGQIIANKVQDANGNPMTTGQIWSGFYDNPITRAMNDINKLSEELMPNYYSTQEEGKAFDFGSMNFWADKVIKNIGFTIGAAWSGAAWSRPLSLLGKGLAESTKFKSMLNITKEARDLATKQGKITQNLVSSSVQNGLGATMSALGEGSIEALNTKNDFISKKIPEIQEQRDQRIRYIRNKYGNSKMAEDLIARENKAYDATVEKIKEDAAAAGNVDLLVNIPILTASNMIQFTRLYSGGFKKSLESLKVKRLADGTYDTMSKAKAVAKAVSKPIISEGSEEILQQYASDVPTNYYNTDVNNFYKARTNRQSEQEVLSWSKALGEQAALTFGSADTWEQFFIGGLTGLLGVPSFIKTKANGKMGFGLSWQSEAISGAKEAAEKAARYNYLSAYMNDRIANNEKFKNYYQGLIRNNTYAKAMDAALEHNDKKAFLDNDLAQLYSDFTMFDSAGRLDDLRAMAKAAIPTSDADVQDLIDNTSTKDLKGEEKEKAEKEKENLKQATTKKEQITQQIQELLNEREEKDLIPEEKLKLDNFKQELNVADEEITTAKANIKDIYDKSKEPWIGSFIKTSGEQKSIEEVREQLNENVKTFEKHLNRYQEIKDDVESILRGRLDSPEREKDVVSELVFRIAQSENWKNRSDEILNKYREILPDSEEKDSYLAQLQEKGSQLDDVLESINEAKEKYIEYARAKAEREGKLDSFDESKVQFPKSITEAEERYKKANDTNVALTNAAAAFRKFKTSTNEEIANLLLTDPDFKQGFANWILNTDKIPAEKKDEYIARLNDVEKMLISKQNASTAIAKYLEDPNTLAQEQEKADAENKEEVAEEKHKEAVEQLRNATVSDINNAKANGENIFSLVREEWLEEGDKEKIKTANDVEKVKNLLLKRLQQAYESGKCSKMQYDLFSDAIQRNYSKANSTEEMLDPSNENYVEAIESNENITNDDVDAAYQVLNDVMNVTQDDIEKAQEVKDFGDSIEGTTDALTISLDDETEGESKAEDKEKDKTKKPNTGSTSATETKTKAKTKTDKKSDETNGEEASAGKDPVTQPKPLKFPTWQWQLLEAGAVLSESSVQSIVENPTFVKFDYYDPLTKKLKWSKGNNMFRCPNGYYLCFIKIPKSNVVVPFLGYSNGKGQLEWNVAVKVDLNDTSKCLCVNSGDICVELGQIAYAMSKRWSNTSVAAKRVLELNDNFTRNVIQTQMLDNMEKSGIDYADLYLNRKEDEDITYALNSAFVPYKKVLDEAVMKAYHSTLKSNTFDETSSNTVQNATNISSEDLEKEIEDNNKKSNAVANSQPTPDNPITSKNIYEFWRDSTTEYKIHRDRGDDHPYWETSGNPAHKILFEYLQKAGVFDRRKNTPVEDIPQSFKLSFDQKLNEQLGFPVLLLTDEDGNIWGDIPNPKDATFSKYRGLQEFYNKAIKEYNQNKDNIKNGLYTLKDEITTAGILIGTPRYLATGERYTLNEICSTKDSSGKRVTKKGGPKIGIMVNDELKSGWNMRISGNEKRDTAMSMQEKKILPPLTYRNGQPFLLIETLDPKRRYYPVPFTMKPFSVKDNSRLANVVKTLFDKNNLPKNQSEANTWAATLKHILALENVETFFKDGKLLSIRVKSFNAEKAINVRTIKDLENIPFNIDTSLVGLKVGDLEDEIFSGLLTKGVDYNELIGEVAETNLPPSADRTINDSIVINPIINGKSTAAKMPQGKTKQKEAANSETDTSKKVTDITETDIKTDTQAEPNNNDKDWYYSDNYTVFAINTKTNAVLNRTTHKVFTVEEASNLNGVYKNMIAKTYIEANNLEITGKTIIETPYGWYDIKNDGFVAAPVETPKAKQPSSTETISEDNTDFNVDAAKETLKKLVTNSVIKSKVIEKLNVASLQILTELPSMEAKDILDSLRAIWRNNTPEQLEEFIKTAKAKTKLVANTKFEQADLDKEIKTLNRMLPQIDINDSVRIVKGLIKTVDGDAYGKFYKGIITLSKQATVGTTYHEGFHYVVNTLFNQSERDALFKHAKALYGEENEAQLEEIMADEFSKYVQDRENKVVDNEQNPIKRFFKKLWNIVSSMYRHKAYVDSVYRNIYNGKYANRSIIREQEKSRRKQLKDKTSKVLNNIKTPIKSYYNNKYKYENLSVEQQQYLQDKGINLKDYNNMNNEEKEVLFKCMN